MGQLHPQVRTHHITHHTLPKRKMQWAQVSPMAPGTAKSGNTLQS